jgi:hypothetical protein
MPWSVAVSGEKLSGRFGVFERPDQTVKTSLREYTDVKQRNAPQ